MSVEGINSGVSPLVLAQNFAAKGAREAADAAASRGSEAIVAQAAEMAPAAERKAREAASERNSLTTYDGLSKRSGGNTTTTGSRVGMFVNTMA